MRSVAVYSLKGGVGKTTLAVNLAWSAASLSSRRTLLRVSLATPSAGAPSFPCSTSAIGAFAGRSPAATAFADLWRGIERKLAKS